MRKTFLPLLAALLLGSAGCGNSFDEQTGPDKPPPVNVPLKKVPSPPPPPPPPNQR